jgi:hypothetical protein
MTIEWRAMGAFIICLLIVCALLYFIHKLVEHAGKIPEDKIIATLEAIGVISIIIFVVADEVFTRAAQVLSGGSHEQASGIWWMIATVALSVIGSVCLFVAAKILIKKYGADE